MEIKEAVNLIMTLVDIQTIEIHCTILGVYILVDKEIRDWFMQSFLGTENV